MKYLLLALPLLVTSCVSASRGPEIEVQGGRSFYAADSSTQATSVRLAYLTNEKETTGIRGVAAVGYERGTAQQGDATLQRVEVDLGLRGRIWGPFYLGVGGAPTVIEASGGAGDSAGKFFLAGYGEVGAEWSIGEHLSAGVSYRHTFGATAAIGDGPRENLNTGTLAASIGWGF